MAHNNGHEEVGQSDGGRLACKCRDKVPASGEGAGGLPVSAGHGRSSLGLRLWLCS